MAQPKKSKLATLFEAFRAVNNQVVRDATRAGEKVGLVPRPDPKRQPKAKP